MVPYTIHYNPPYNLPFRSSDYSSGEVEARHSDRSFAAIATRGLTPQSSDKLECCFDLHRGFFAAPDSGGLVESRSPSTYSLLTHTVVTICARFTVKGPCTHGRRQAEEPAASPGAPPQVREAGLRQRHSAFPIFVLFSTIPFFASRCFEQSTRRE